MSVKPKLYGSQSMTAQLRRVLVRAPRAEDLHGWQMCGWRAEPDPMAIAAEHEAFCELLEGAGAEVVLAESPADGNPDAIYTYDPALVADGGALLLHPGKESRRSEVPAMAEDFKRAGVPVAGRLEDPEWAEGGDLCWLDEHKPRVSRTRVQHSIIRLRLGRHGRHARISKRPELFHGLQPPI